MNPDGAYSSMRIVLTVGGLATAALVTGCGGSTPAVRAPRTEQNATAPAALVREARPIGHAARFHPHVRGPVIGPCRPRLGIRRGVHIEIFAANRVVLLAAGIGTRPPRRIAEGRITSAGCFGALVTLEPTGVVLVRRGSRLTLAAVFRSWGQPLSARRVASFSAQRGHGVRVFVGGRRWTGPVGAVPLRPRAEIVVEVGPYVPPHSRYTFPPGA